MSTTSSARAASANEAATSKSVDLHTLAKQITARPLPGTNTPGSFAFATAYNMLLFLDSDPSIGDFRFLASMNTKTMERRNVLRPEEGDTEENLSLEEKLRRERTRALAIGVTSFSKCGSRTLLIPLHGCVYVLDFAEPNSSLVMAIPKTVEPTLDPRASPPGNKLAFVRNGDLYAMTVDEKTMTFGKPVLVSLPASQGTNGLTNGLASFLAQEELDRQTGYWWSRDGKYILYEHVDERSIEEYTIVHQCDNISDEKHRYPFAGKNNPITELWLANVDARLKGDASPSIQLNMTLSNGETDVYLSRVDWHSATKVFVQLMNREQTRLELYLYDVTTSPPTRRLMLHESTTFWINLHDLIESLEKKDATHEYFIWGSERSGFSHLYLYKFNNNDKNQKAEVVRQITSGDFVVEALGGIDEANDLIYFFGGSVEDPTERHLYVTRLFSNESGTAYLRLSAPGCSYGSLNSSCRQMVLSNSTVGRAPTVTLESLPEPSAVIQELNKSAKSASSSSNKRLRADEQPSIVTHPPIRETAAAGPVSDASLSLKTTTVHVIAAPPKNMSLPPFLKSAPAAMRFTLSSGETMYAHLFIPEGKGPFKTVVQIYGGPHVQRVRNEWYSTIDLRAHALASLGYLVVRCDNRGSSRRGLSFESAIHRCMGTVELEDQIACLRELEKLKLCDMNHVGITGWSYGGYMTAMALAKYPDIFKVGVSGAPVTSWDGYDTAYTERYMGTPESNPKGYFEGSVMTHAAGLQGKLLLVHGMVDENVHFRHTARLIEKLIELGKPYDLLILPDERHGPRKMASRIYLEERILNYFIQHL